MKVSLLLFNLCLLASIAGNYVITNYFPTRLVNPDLMFMIFPYHITYEYASDVLFILGIAVFALMYFLTVKQKRYDMINMISIFYIFRSILMILTPLMRPTGVDMPSHGIFREQITQFGMFPSGHVGLLAIMYFMISAEEFPKLKKFFLYLVIASAILMIISLGHYSIDVAGGIMLAYIVVNEYRKRTEGRGEV